MTPMKTLEKNLTEASRRTSTMDRIKSYLVNAKKHVAETLSMCRHRLALASEQAKEVASDPATQVAAASAAGGAATIGAGTASVGFVTGGAVGAAVGLVPALFTFGLSIPVGAALGAGCGAAFGGALGGATGMAGAGAAGYKSYKHREDIKALFDEISSQASKHSADIQAVARSRAAVLRGRASTLYSGCLENVKTSRGSVETFCAKVQERGTALSDTTKSKVVQLAVDPAMQVTLASAVGGAAVAGTGGAATGLVTGGTIGAIVGVVPAVFTFGLSIPICAAIGGGCGTAMGAVVGGTAGALGGGATGYSVYTKREAIGSSVHDARAAVGDAAQFVKEHAASSAATVKARLVGGTGGTSGMGSCCSTQPVFYTGECGSTASD